MPFTQGIALGQNQDSRLELMATVRADAPDLPGEVWHVREAREDPGWPPQWESLGMAVDSGVDGLAPAIARNKDERLEVVITSAAALLHGSQTEPNGDEWHHSALGRPAETVLTPVTPALARNQEGRLEAFVLASSAVSPEGTVSLAETGQLWTIRQDPAAPGGWLPWLELGAPAAVRLRDRPAVALNRDGRLDVFLHSDRGTVHHIWQDPAGLDGWSQWDTLGDPQVALRGQPVVARNKDGRLEVFMVGTDGALWHIWQDPAAADGWSPRRWHPLEGGPFSGSSS